MDDKELLNYVERKTFQTMLEGCEIMNHLGHQEHEVGSWSVRLRADEVARLLDMAKEKKMDDQKNACLGDAVYASFDGYQIWLAVNHHENKVLALDPFVFARLCEYAEMMKVKST